MTALTRMLNPTVILAFYVSTFTDNPFLVGLIPLLIFSGMMVTQFFWAGLLGRVRRRKPLYVVGTLLSRTSLLLLLVSALVAGRGGAALPLGFFFGALTLFSVANGLVHILWTGFVAESLAEGRGRFLGYTFLADGLLSLSGAAAIRWLLGRGEFPQNFVYAFGLVAAVALVSAVPALLFREPDRELIPGSAPSPLALLRSVPAMFRGNPIYAHYMSTRLLVAAAELAAPFFTIHAVTRLNAGAGHVGIYSTLAVTGALVANPVLGRVGDRFGFMTVFRIGFVIGAFNLLLVWTARSPEGIYLPMFLMGIYGQCILIAVIGMNMSTAPAHLVTRFAGVANAMTGLVLGVAPVVGAALMKNWGFGRLLAVCLVLYVLTMAQSLRQPVGMSNKGEIEHAT